MFFFSSFSLAVVVESSLHRNQSRKNLFFISKKKDSFAIHWIEIVDLSWLGWAGADDEVEFQYVWKRWKKACILWKIHIAKQSHKAHTHTDYNVQRFIAFVLEMHDFPFVLIFHQKRSDWNRREKKTTTQLFHFVCSQYMCTEWKTWCLGSSSGWI